MGIVAHELSDKDFWHGYLDFYEQHFAGRTFKNIAEFGICSGASARWLLQRFPDSQIYGCDIVESHPDWPVDPRYTIVHLDQGNRAQVTDFVNLQSFNLVIEDGSHYPHHQVYCLLAGIPALAPGGIYIVEDIQTSLNQNKGNALSVLLAIDHYRRISKTVTKEIAEKIAENSFMTSEDVLMLDANIDKLYLYRRAQLPNRCYNCGSDEFNYSSYKCRCGADIFSLDDSMSYLIVKK